jgi:hypothetical protein
MTYGMKWTTLATVLILLVSIFIGHASHAKNEQTGKFNLDCVNAGGVLEYHKEAGAIFCNKDK